MADLASVFGSPFLQSRRLLRLSFPDGDAPPGTDAFGRTSPPAIVIERLEAEEALSRDFRYELSLLADSA
ncbi:MAG: hypothetical protein RET84_07745, partial [Pseudomonadota bacterium]|nr:hypothetical protein [Pseudomonadota bacterium]